MNGMYLIPANSKKSMLIFGLFTKFDLILFASGVGISLFMLSIVKSNNIWMTVASILPGLIAGFLVMPVLYHHNMLTVIKSVYAFYTGRQKFIWRGWCVNNEQNGKK